MILVEKACSFCGGAEVVSHEDIGRADHLPALASEAPTQFCVLAVHEKGFVEETCFTD
jgi:hypothetical protein